MSLQQRDCHLLTATLGLAVFRRTVAQAERRKGRCRMTLYDVVAVNLKTNKVRIFGQNKSERNADAIINMAIMRRGVDEEFYTTAKPGQYKEGDCYQDK